MFNRKCKCIKDTTVDKIAVGNYYKFGTETVHLRLCMMRQTKHFKLFMGIKNGLKNTLKQ